MGVHLTNLFLWQYGQGVCVYVCVCLYVNLWQVRRLELRTVGRVDIPRNCVRFKGSRHYVKHKLPLGVLSRDDWDNGCLYHDSPCTTLMIQPCAVLIFMSSTLLFADWRTSSTTAFFHQPRGVVLSIINTRSLVVGSRAALNHRCSRCKSDGNKRWSLRCCSWRYLRFRLIRISSPTDEATRWPFNTTSRGVQIAYLSWSELFLTSSLSLMVFFSISVTVLIKTLSITNWDPSIERIMRLIGSNEAFTNNYTVSSELI